MKNKYLRNFFFVVIILIAIFIFISSKKDLHEIWNEIKNANRLYLLYGLINVIVYWLFWIIPIIVLTNFLNRDISQIDTLAIGASEFFFNGITPFGTGGSPVQIYLLNKRGVSTANSTGIVLSNFIAYQLLNNLICVIGIISFYNTLKYELNNFMIVVLIAFLGNFLLLVVFLLMAFSSKFEQFIHFLFQKLSKITLFTKRIQQIQLKVHEFVLKMQKYCSQILLNSKLMIKIFVTKFISIIALYLTPYFVLKSLGIDYGNWALIITASALTTCVFTWIPTPGGAGGAEVFFTLMFVPLLGLAETIAVAAALLWRFFNYYLTLFFGFLMYLVYERRLRKNARGNLY